MESGNSSMDYSGKYLNCKEDSYTVSNFILFIQRLL